MLCVFSRQPNPADPSTPQLLLLILNRVLERACCKSKMSCCKSVRLLLTQRPMAEARVQARNSFVASLRRSQHLFAPEPISVAVFKLLCRLDGFCLLRLILTRRLSCFPRRPTVLNAVQTQSESAHHATRPNKPAGSNAASPRRPNDPAAKVTPTPRVLATTRPDQLDPRRNAGTDSLCRISRNPAQRISDSGTLC